MEQINGQVFLKLSDGHDKSEDKNNLEQLFFKINSLQTEKITNELSKNKISQEISSSMNEISSFFVDIHELISLLKDSGPNNQESKYMLMLQQKLHERLATSLNRVHSTSSFEIHSFLQKKKKANW